MIATTIMTSNNVKPDRRRSRLFVRFTRMSYSFSSVTVPIGGSINPTSRCSS
jgi:hypothetical protein